MLIGCSFHLFFLSVSLWPVFCSLYVFPLSLCQILSLSFSLSDQCLSRESGQRLHSPQRCFTHSHGVVVFLIALCPPPLICRPVDTLTFDLGSGAGRDDSRTCFSLWVYYLCSGPIKATPQSTSGSGCSGSQCGEFGSPPSHPPLPPLLPFVFLSSLLGRG